MIDRLHPGGEQGVELAQVIQFAAGADLDEELLAHGPGRVGHAARCQPGAGPFPRGLPPNRADPFPSTRLSSDYDVSCGVCGCMDVSVAAVADHQGLTTPFHHRLYPYGLVRTGLDEVGELVDVMHLDAIRLPAELASPLQQPFDQLLVGIERSVRLTVDDDRCLLPFERDPAEPGDQWVPAVADDAGLEARARPVRCHDFGLVLGRHLRHRRAVLTGQGLEHRSLHDPAQPVQSLDVTGQQTVVERPDEVRDDVRVPARAG